MKNKNIFSKRLLGAFITIFMLMTLLVSGTFALFTDTINLKGNQVTAGNVNILATLKLTETQTQIIGDVENSKIEVVNGRKIVMDNIMPGDKGFFTLSCVNNSTVAIKYFIAIVASETDTSLFEALNFENITFGNVETAVWTDLSANTNPADKDFSIELPMSLGNDYQGTSFSFDIFIYAVQSNGVSGVVFASDVDTINNAPMGSTVVLSKNITSDVAVALNHAVNIDLNEMTLTVPSFSIIDDAIKGTCDIEDGAIVTTSGDFSITVPNGTVNLTNVNGIVKSTRRIFFNASVNTVNLTNFVAKKYFSNVTSTSIADIVIPSDTRVVINEVASVNQVVQKVQIKIEDNSKNVIIVDNQKNVADSNITVNVPGTATEIIVIDSEENKDIILSGNGAAGVNSDLDWYLNNKDATVFNIGTAKELKGLAFLFNTGVATFVGKTISLTSDIDLTGVEWTPIGLLAKKFEGTFEGNNKTIKGMSITKHTSNGVGMFGVTNNATIKNTKLLDVDIQASVRASVGGIVGNSYGKLSIENCEVSGDIIASNNVAGIVGYVEGQSASNKGTATIVDCTNNANITFTKGNSAGIIAINNNLSELTIKNCTNTGSIQSVSATTAVGGVAGYLNTINGNILIENCVNDGEIKANSSNSGGLVGYTTNENPVDGVVIKNCENNGSVSGSANVGGLIGIAAGKSYITIQGSVNNGEVVSLGSAGGIAGGFDGEMTDCKNTGKVTANSGNAVGAVVTAGGQRGIVIIDNFVNTGALVGTLTADLCGTVNNSTTIKDIDASESSIPFVLKWQMTNLTFEGNVNFNGNIDFSSPSFSGTMILAENAVLTINGENSAITSNSPNAKINMGTNSVIKTVNNNFFALDETIGGEAQIGTNYIWQWHVGGNGIHGWKASA